MSRRDEILAQMDEVEQKYLGHEGVAVLVKAVRRAVYTDFYVSPYFSDWWDQFSLDLNQVLYGNERGAEG